MWATRWSTVSIEFAHVEVPGALAWAGIEETHSALVTLHRPGNLDDHARIEALTATLMKVAERLPVVWRAHARTTTERPVTIAEGTNRLVDPRDEAAIPGAVGDVLTAPIPAAARPALWDGHAAERIVAVIAEWAQNRA